MRWRDENQSLVDDGIELEITGNDLSHGRSSKTARFLNNHDVIMLGDGVGGFPAIAKKNVNTEQCLTSGYKLGCPISGNFNLHSILYLSTKCSVA